jgi:acyl transferase domain-containing protein/NADP-dependent 3-hydroxy acid dehydrogenase YdfG
MERKYSRKEVLSMVESGQMNPMEAIKYIGDLKDNKNNVNDETLYYQTIWKEQLAVASDESQKSDSIICIKLGSTNSLYERVVNSFQGKVIKVNIGNEFEKYGETSYSIDMKSIFSYQRLLNECHSDKNQPLTILMIADENFDEEEQSLKKQMKYTVDVIFYMTKALFVSNIEKAKCIFLYQLDELAKQPLFQAVSSWFRILSQENPNYKSKTIEIMGDSCSIEQSMGNVIAEIQSSKSDDGEVRFSRGIRYIKTLQRKTIVQNKPTKLFKSSGAYLITGGSGKLGQYFAQKIMEKTDGVVVLIGRRKPDSRLESWIREKNELKVRVIYEAVDVFKSDDVKNLIKKVKSEYQAIRGICHCAGEIKDTFFLNKEKMEWDRVLSAKVYGTVWLDYYTKHEPLEFFVTSSSIAAIIASIGQSDYGFANGFMDAYMNYRNMLVKQGLRNGKSISINWGLWNDGNMKVDDKKLILIKEKFGIIPMETNDGLQAWTDALENCDDQIVILQGDKEKIDKIFIFEEKKDDEEKGVKLQSEEGNKELQRAVEQYLKEILSKQAKIPINKIKSTEMLEKYGIDSMMIMELNTEIEKQFGKLSKTIFFEYQTIEELAGYFSQQHTQKSIELLVKSRGLTQNKIENKASVKAVREENVKPKVMIKQEQNNQPMHTEDDDIAIIGLAGYYPMAKDLDEFWENLKAGMDCITEIPIERWDYRKNYSPDRKKINKTYSKWGSFIMDIDKFDPLFFKIAPREAELMDPQERYFLQTAWHTLEDAGYTPKTLQDKMVGVFVGAMFNQYQMFGADHALDGNNLVPSSSFASIANRTSYFMNFRGPSIAVDTMCSSSLTTIHLAANSIKNGECDVALAGGVNLIIHPHKYRLLSQGGFLSSNGRCQSFSEGGDGYVPGEGVGAVLLKPLKKAVRDKDHIYAVIKGSSINHGGKTNGYSVPNPNMQAKLIEKAIRDSSIDVEDISYVEAHGTGTSLGDPIEITGLKKAYEQFSKKKQFCSIGSLKSNIGHLESAAGIAGITKILLQMKYKKLVPSIHSEVLNSNIPFESTPFYVQKELADWKTSTKVENGKVLSVPRIAGISAFGAGGSNVHMILQEYQCEYDGETEENGRIELFPFSAKNEEQLCCYIKSFIKFLEKYLPDNKSEIPVNNLLRKDIKEILAAQLEIPVTEIIDDEDWNEYGCDAVKVIQFAQKVLEKYSIDIYENVLFEQNTVDLFVEYLLKQNTEAIENYYGGNVSNNIRNEYVERVRLRDIAYTLQVGREDMEERLLVMAGSIEELHETLYKYINGEKDLANEFVGSTRENNQDDLFDEDDVEILIQQWLRKNKVDKLGQAWGKGIFTGWNFYPRMEDCKKISLPTYQFEKMQCWVEEEKEIEFAKRKQHPFIDYNCSNLEETKFVGFVPFENKLLINGRSEEEKVLPAVALIEMVCESSSILGLGNEINIERILFGKEVRVRKEGISLETKFFKQKNNVAFEISSIDKKNNTIVYLQGILIKELNVEKKINLNIDELLNRLNMTKTIHGSEIKYNEQEIFANINSSDEEEAYCISPFALSESFWMLQNFHKGFASGKRISLQKIKSVRIYHSACENMSIYIKKTFNKEYSISLLNEKGEVLAALISVIVKEEVPVEMDKIAVDSTAVTTAELEQWIESNFISMVSELLKIDPNQLDIHENFGAFGFDSVSLKQLSDKITDYYEIEISPTVFFSQTNLNDLIKYMIDEFEEVIRRKYADTHQYDGSNKSTIYESENNEEIKLTPLAATLRDNDKSLVGTFLEEEPIAVIGMHGLFPQCHDLQEYWDNLRDKKDLISEVPPERWDWHDFYSDSGAGKLKTGSRWGGFIPDVDKFDPRFFNMSPKEAEMMDPQHRIFLETVWKTIEDAGYRASDFSGRDIGLFVGVQFNDYQQLLAMQGESNSQMGLGNEHSILVNRISYLLNLHGPSEPYNTACSSASVALHRAVRSIRSGESELAVAGGISLMLSPLTMIGADQLGILSPDGRCKTLDKSANGYVKGEGIGALLLKPLSKAEKDHDHIYALIKGTAVNHGGKATSLTAPNSKAQSSLLVKAYEEAQIEPDTISYLELHGTGTELGDPVEIEGIKSAFKKLAKINGKPITKREYCGIGSVKTNIGHLEPASGIAGIMKVILAMQNETLPGMLHLNELNPYVDIEDTPFYIVKDTMPWKRLKDEYGREIPLRAGVSSFGFGGVNAHIVLEEYKNSQIAENDENTAYAIILSAKNKERLDDKVNDLIHYLKKVEIVEDISLSDVAYTLQVGRETMRERLAIVTSSIKELINKLQEYEVGSQQEENIFTGSVKENASKQKGEKVVLDAIVKRDVKTLCKLWIKNVDVDWNLLYDIKPYRIPLPTYPFARERYWAPKKLSDLAKTSQKNMEMTIAQQNNRKMTSTIEVEKVIKSIIAEELRFDQNELEVDEEFSSYGIDSIISANIMRRVQEVYGEAISLYAIVNYPTIQQLTEYIKQQTDIAEINIKQVETKKEQRTVNKKYPNEVVPINPKGTHQNTFWFHGSLGYVQVYNGLSAALGADYPFYAIQAKGIDGKSMPHIYLDEMASYYVSCIKSIQPEGPYCICGYSLGGLIAYEIAQQLVQNGDEISEIIMIDTYPTHEKMLELYFNTYDYEQTSIMIANGFIDLRTTEPIKIEDLEGIPPRLHIAHLARLVKQKSNRAMTVEDIYNCIKGSVDVNLFSEEMYKTYVPKEYNASEVLFFKASQGFIKEDNTMQMQGMNFSDSFDYLQPWRNLIKNLRVIEVPGDHLTMLEEPALSIIRDEVSKVVK